MKSPHRTLVTIIAIIVMASCGTFPSTPTDTLISIPSNAPAMIVTDAPTHTPTNTFTPSPTNTSTTTPIYTPTTSRPNTLGIHVVRPGEWLYCIGRAYRVSPQAIAGVNGLVWPSIIFPNQRLTIPNVPWTNIPAGPICTAQFTGPASAPSPTYTPTPTTAALLVMDVTMLTPQEGIPAGGATYLEYAEMISCNNPVTTCSISLSNNPSFNSSDKVCVLWIEAGRGGPGQELSLAIHHNGQLRASVNTAVIGSRVCRIANVPLTATGNYETILVSGDEEFRLPWSIRE